jgi:hypothetical protein
LWTRGVQSCARFLGQFNLRGTKRLGLWLTDLIFERVTLDHEYRNGAKKVKTLFAPFLYILKIKPSKVSCH